MNFWDKIAGTPEEAARYMDNYGEGVETETRDIIASFINDGESVLDVGCGPGWNYERFKKLGPQVSRYKGVDYSKVMIDGCKLKYPEADFDIGDARNLSRQDRESFDVVILQDVLEHTNGYKKPVIEALRVARKRIIISFWHLEETDNEHINDDGDDGWGAWYDQRKWEQYLDSLDLHWLKTETSEQANRPHKFYIIDKEVKHGAIPPAGERNYSRGNTDETY